MLQNKRYEIGCVIGAGGFGVTYAAWDHALQIRIAIKEYLPGEFSTRAPENETVSIYGGEKTEQYKDGLVKFYEESKRLAKFQGEAGIVQIFDVFMENETAYIVMEYLEGETLGERLKREEKIRYQDAVQIMIPVLQALAVVHKENILHRDIAPNNIFLCASGEIKILDFGAARSATGTHSKSLTVLYKEGYTPEEQYRSKGEQGSWTDVYACAATLYRMVTGIIPPGALERRVKDKLKEPSHYAHMSKQINGAILNALNVDAKNRTQTAEQFLEELTERKKVKKHFVRTMEQQIGVIPFKIRIGLAVAFIVVSSFFLLLITGIIEFKAGSYANFLISQGRVRVPNIVNMEVNEAQEILENRKLLIQIQDKQFSDEIPKDRILSQSVKAGKVADEGMVVEVVVSGGEKKVENGYQLAENETLIPDFLYENLDEVKDYEDVQVKCHLLFEKNDTVAETKILRQSIEAGAIVEDGTEMTLIVNAPKALAQAYDLIVAKDYNSLLSVDQEIIDFMESYGMKSLFFRPDESEENRKSGTGLTVYNLEDSIEYYWGNYKDNQAEGKGISIGKCTCGAREPYMIYDGEWRENQLNGQGTVYSHWRNGDKYQITGNFEDGYGEGVMQMQWESDGRTYHGDFLCRDHIIQEAETAWYSQYFQLTDPSSYIYVYSDETIQDIPQTADTIGNGFGVGIAGFMQIQ